ncbi:13191_t:CDS:2 [Entrophospora sp. SA101]|nr:13191_t:CDS:2 [Entrophospora sp. SA101]
MYDTSCWQKCTATNVVQHWRNKRNQHLQKACETKKMKETIKPITDEYIDKEVFENESQIDTNILSELDVNEPGLEIEELIYQYIESGDD